MERPFLQPVSRLASRARGLLAAALLVSPALAAALVPSRGDADGLTSTLEMAGRAVIEAPADMALIEVSAKSEAGSACDALALDATVADRIVLALAGLGVTHADLETTGFRVETAAKPDNPMANPPGEVEIALLEPESGGQTGIGASGGANGVPQRDQTGELFCTPAETYRVTTGLVVALRSLSALDDALDALGGVSDLAVVGVRYAPADPNALLVRARNAAIDDARAKAEAYAQTMGLTLGSVLHVVPRGARLLNQPGEQAEPGPVRAEADALVTFEVRWD